MVRRGSLSRAAILEVLSDRLPAELAENIADAVLEREVRCCLCGSLLMRTIWCEPLRPDTQFAWRLTQGTLHVSTHTSSAVFERMPGGGCTSSVGVPPPLVLEVGDDAADFGWATCGPKPPHAISVRGVLYRARALQMHMRVPFTRVGSNAVCSVTCRRVPVRILKAWHREARQGQTAA